MHPPTQYRFVTSKSALLIYSDKNPGRRQKPITELIERLLMRDALDGQFLEAAGFAEFLDEGFGLMSSSVSWVASNVDHEG
jgi:hypothetical protein